jgi:spore germination cell wall hydrolase CwlJ-like protein
MIKHLCRALSLILLFIPQLGSTNKSDYFVIHNPKIEKNNLEEREIDCLAKNIYFEARGEPLVGQMAVAQVTLNRVKSPKYPNTICDVVYQAKKNDRGIPIRNKCQFSWYCDGKADKVHDVIRYENVRKLAIKMLSLDSIDITEGALYYHSYKVSPYWKTSMIKTVTIEGHTFYKRA